MSFILFVKAKCSYSWYAVISMAQRQQQQQQLTRWTFTVLTFQLHQRQDKETIIVAKTHKQLYCLKSVFFFLSFFFYKMQSLDRDFCSFRSIHQRFSSKQHNNIKRNDLSHKNMIVICTRKCSGNFL